MLIAAGPVLAAAPASPPAPWLLDQVKALAASEMEGRASGGPGADRAARLASELHRLGLRPGGDDGGWQQAFTVPTGIRFGDVNTLSLMTPASRALARRPAALSTPPT